MYDLIATYGIDALTWVLLALSALLLRWVFPLVQNAWANGVLNRAWTEVKAAVLEVGQTYVDALKEGKADGKLTEDEKSLAKSKAIAVAKSNIGKKGLKALARIVGVDVEKWLGSKVESAVAVAKAAKPGDPR